MRHMPGRGGREGGREGGGEGGVRKMFVGEGGRYGCHFDGLDEANTMGRERETRDGGTEGGDVPKMK